MLPAHSTHHLSGAIPLLILLLQMQNKEAVNNLSLRNGLHKDNDMIHNSRGSLPIEA
jgi:hypothetical protein